MRLYDYIFFLQKQKSTSLNAGRDFTAKRPFSILNKNVKNDILI